MNDRLYKIVEYILNIADDDELQVIDKALEKRLSEGPRSQLGLNPARLAAESTDRISEQLEDSKTAVKRMVADFAADIIRKNAPELNERQVNELLREFMPGGTASRHSADDIKGGKTGEGALPPGMVIQMVRQFIDYSEGAMSAAEQVQMEEEIPGWKEKYWKAFPGQVQKLISLYLNGEIDRQRFEAHLCEILGL